MSWCWISLIFCYRWCNNDGYKATRCIATFAIFVIHRGRKRSKRTYRRLMWSSNRRASLMWSAARNWPLHFSSASNTAVRGTGNDCNARGQYYSSYPRLPHQSTTAVNFSSLPVRNSNRKSACRVELEGTQRVYTFSETARNSCHFFVIIQKRITKTIFWTLSLFHKDDNETKRFSSVFNNILFSPRGMHDPWAICFACVNFFFFKNKHLNKAISESRKPIFSKFSRYVRYLVLDCQFDPLFRWLNGRCHGNQF